jgi:hypothetical protein
MRRWKKFKKSEKQKNWDYEISVLEWEKNNSLHGPVWINDYQIIEIIKGQMHINR